jgi:protein gp37
MGKNSKITWTHHTFNPWWGCVKLPGRPACDNCYAEALAKRYGFKLWGMTAPRREFSLKHWNEPHKWNREAAAAGERRRVFCGSMCDIFEDLRYGLLDDLRQRLWTLIEQTPSLDWLLLSKRLEYYWAMLPESWRFEGPPKNVWIGTTVENQEVAEKAIERLINCPVKTRFLSVEPLLERLDLSRWINAVANTLGTLLQPPEAISWVIIGCESGPQRRPCNIEWVRDLVAQCRAAGVAVFVKQLEINGRVETDPRKWPEDLRIQEFPEVSHG